MKKIIISILVIMLLFTSLACSRNNETTVESTEEVDRDPADLIPVNVTMPASFYNDMTVREIMAKKGKDGIDDIVLNDDGSVTMTMATFTYNQNLETLKDTLNQIMSDMRSNVYPSIISVEHNDELSEYTIVVDKSEYTINFDDVATTVIGVTAHVYRIFMGDDYNTVSITFDIVDKNDDKVFQNVKYP